jgi:hypothetical protein
MESSSGKKQESHGKKQGQSDVRKKDFTGNKQVSGGNMNQVLDRNKEHEPNGKKHESSRKR